MVLGIGEGSIEMQLEKPDFAPGQAIRGKIILNLKKPIDARELVVCFFGRTHGKTGGRKYLVTRVLGDARTYQSGESFDFELLTPTDIIPKDSPLSDNLMLEILTIGYQWCVEAKLDMPMKFDVSKTRELKIKLPQKGSPPA